MEQTSVKRTMRKGRGDVRGGINYFSSTETPPLILMQLQNTTLVCLRVRYLICETAELNSYNHNYYDETKHRPHMKHRVESESEAKIFMSSICLIMCKIGIRACRAHPKYVYFTKKKKKKKKKKNSAVSIICLKILSKTYRKWHFTDYFKHYVIQ